MEIEMKAKLKIKRGRGVLRFILLIGMMVM